MTLIDVAEVEKLSQTAFTHHTDSAGISASGFFLVLCRFSKGIVVGFIYKNSGLGHTHLEFKCEYR